jgi:hypothetical protein
MKEAPTSSEFNTRHTGCIFNGAHKRGSCHRMHQRSAQGGKTRRKAPQIFSQKISEFGGAFSMQDPLHPRETKMPN